MFASQNGHMNIVKYLVEKGATINFPRKVNKNYDAHNSFNFPYEMNRKGQPHL